MRYLIRLNTPQVLVEKKEEWTRKFIESGKRRPDSSKYAHYSVKESLQEMSLHKCFYCERSLKGITSEVDHYYEVSETPEKAFEWENLYLACSDCNKKLPNRSIPNHETLNPCVHSDEEIMRHITFENEIIRPANGSAQGLQTIKKYKLDSQQLDYLRIKQQQYFSDLLLAIQAKMIREKRKHLTQAETAVLKSFAQIEHPFSLMFKILLAKYPQLEM